MPRLFEITRRADYATRIMLELGQQPAQSWLPASCIARQASVPKAFLHKITANLVEADLVKTYPGPTGGLALARPAHTINLLQILEAIDGPLCVNLCQRHAQACARDLICPAHTVWGRVQNSLITQLQSVTLDQLVAEARVLRQHPRRREAPAVTNVISPKAIRV